LTNKSQSKSDYLTTCKKLISDLKKSKLNKVVLSKLKIVPLKDSPEKIFGKLNEKYTNTFNYLISIEGLGCWIGASPELLFNLDNNQFNSVSLAGTKSDVSIPWGEKELEEQQIVTDFIHKQLLENCTKITVDGPNTLNAGTFYHLQTKFSAQTKFENWQNLVNNLHPTPATCGLPQQLAKDHIVSIEPHNREFYTGFLGPVNSSKMSLFVNLRCMQIVNENAILYLGGGITAQSNSNDEWDETEKKSETLLKVISK
jgi:isochorismate synthase